MPPQQSSRLLDLGDDGFDFGTHRFRDQESGIRRQGSGTKRDEYGTSDAESKSRSFSPRC
jgi:hypothetical protein